MRWTATILIVCLFACSPTKPSKTYILDSSESTGNLVGRQWWIDGAKYDTAIAPQVTITKPILAKLIVIDNKGRKDSVTQQVK